MDSNSPFKDLLFPRGPNLAQKPWYLVSTVLKLIFGTLNPLAVFLEGLTKALFVLCSTVYKPVTVADPDLEPRGGEGGGLDLLAMAAIFLSCHFFFFYPK